MSGRTTLIVSHRLSIIRPCTQIAVIDQGKLAELGTHEQLLEQNGLYAKMYNMQMGLQAETFAK
jgi:ABC-type multidrug transport system fused ATPase/permease subunit